MAAGGFPVGHVVWAKWAQKLYTGIVEPLPEGPEYTGKCCVRWFPDMKQCSYVKQTYVWDYRENRERFMVDRQLKANKDWRKLIVATDKHLGITADIPEPRGSTRNSSSEMPSDTTSTSTVSSDHIVNPASAVKASPKPTATSPLKEKEPLTVVSSPHATLVISIPPDAVDAIEIPDEEMRPLDEYAFVDETAMIEPPPPPPVKTSPRRSNSKQKRAAQLSPEKKPVKNGKKQSEEEPVKPVVIETPVAEEIKKTVTEQPEPTVQVKRGRGRPPNSVGSAASLVGESPVKKSKVVSSNGGPKNAEGTKEVKKRGRPSLSSPKQKGEKRDSSQPRTANRPSLPPVCSVSSGNAAFDEAYTSFHRKMASSDLREMPKIVPPLKSHDSKPSRAVDSFQENSLRYGFIGLQSLSLIFVRHLCSWKSQVFVWDANPVIVKQAASFGATACHSRSQVVDASHVVFTSLLTEREAHEAFFTPDDGIIACADPSKSIVDLGTPNVEYVQQIHEMLSERRIAYLYCATFGNVVDAADNKLSFCVAGSSRLYKDIADLLRSLGGTYETPDGHWQDPTMALKVKTISDMLVTSQNLAFCEAMAVAQKCGLPGDFMLKVMRHQSKDHFSQCLPAEASMIGATSEIKTKDDSPLLPLSLVATAAVSSDEKRHEAEALRSLTSTVGYTGAFARCFSSLANESGLNAQSLFVAMHATIAAKSASNGNEDISALFLRLTSLT